MKYLCLNTVTSHIFIATLFILMQWLFFRRHVATRTTVYNAWCNKPTWWLLVSSRNTSAENTITHECEKCNNSVKSDGVQTQETMKHARMLNPRIKVNFCADTQTGNSVKLDKRARISISMSSVIEHIEYKQSLMRVIHF